MTRKRKGLTSKPAALQKARVNAGHTMRSLARKSGVSVQRISELENETEIVGLRPTTAKRLAKALGVDIDDIAQQGVA